MKVTDYPIKDEVSGTTYNRLKKIEASNGEFIIVGSNTVIYENLMDFINKQITHYTFRLGDYKRDCAGRRYTVKELEVWKRIKEAETRA